MAPGFGPGLFFRFSRGKRGQESFVFFVILAFRAVSQLFLETIAKLRLPAELFVGLRLEVLEI
jgi:hypothetical protein